MAHPARRQTMSAQDFLAWEAGQAQRHEFIGGEVFAMAGAEDRHGTVALNLAMALRQHLAGTPCRTYMSDMKLHVAAAQSYFYPDVLVTCSPADHASPLVKTEPSLLIEVLMSKCGFATLLIPPRGAAGSAGLGALSRTTAAYDRGEKFARYRGITSLREYVLVDIDARSTDVYRKGNDGLWVLHPFDAGQAVTLDSMGLEIAADRLFAEVDPVPPPAG